MKRITSILLAVVMLLGAVTSGGITAFAAENYPLNSIVIKIEDAVTHSMLPGARFEIYYSNDEHSGGYGTLVATVDSDSSGVIVLSGIPSGYYIVRETVPPNNYHLSINNEQHCYIKPDGTSIEELVFSNYRYGGLLVYLSDKDTGAPIGGATFSVTDVNNSAVGNSADGHYVTDANGEFYLENLPAGDYKITQLTAAQGYAMDSIPNMRTVRLQHTSADQSVYRATFSNSPLGTLLVRLKDNVSKEPLAGGVFSVKLSGGADMGEFATDAQGTFTLPKIARGTYIVTQISAPAGYLLESNAKTQYVNYVNTYAVDFTNSPKSGLYVTKYDAATKAPLKDAQFKVYQDNTLIGSYTTNAEGVFFIPNLAPGWYTVTEYAAPQGYITDNTPKTVQVIAETLHRLEFENSKKASLQIVKTDEFSAEPLSGAKFRVTKQNGEFVADVTTDNSGRAYIAELEPGWYVISETKAPTGYIATEAARTVEVKSTVPTVVTITNRAENNLQILKLDYFSRTPLAGATFRVERSNGAFIGTFRTDAAGKILVGNLKEDTYVISEIAAPDGYQLDSEPQIVALSGGLMRSVEFHDKPLSGIEILKTDEFSHAPLTGATFTVERDNGEKIGTYKTDTSGKIIVSDLTDGTYIVSETIAPVGYIRDTQPQTVIVKSGKLTSAEFTNKPLSGIEILKTDSKTNVPLSGAVFTIERTNGERVGKYTTDIAGKILVSDLTEGVYIISEVEAPNEYILDSSPKMVEVKSGKLAIAEFTDTPYPFLYIKKIDANTGAMLAGAQFTVAKLSGEVIANVTSVATGAVAVKVAPGVYVVTETKAPDGYELNDPVQTVEVFADGSAVYHGGNGGPAGAVPGNTATFANRPLNTIEIVKLDSVSHNPLSGAMFDVTKADGEKIGSYRTDASGKALVTDLPEGTYVISETAAPNGYILNETPKPVNVGGGRLVSVEFLNKPLSGIQIVKTDAVSGAPLAGAAFSVTKANGETIGAYKTEADGKVFVSGLDEGQYIVGETKAPDGYIIDNTPKVAVVKSERLTMVEFTNRPLSGIEIIKLDAVTHKPLQGASFTVTKADGERIGTFKTEADGKALVSDLAEGVYVVGETQAPDGYQLDETPKNVTVESGKLATVEFTDKPFSGIEIIKTDSASHAPLSGATFTVERDNGEKIGTYKTDNAGKIIVSGLTEGMYIVSETIAPDGYVLDNAPQTVTVKSGKLTATEFVNKPFSGIEIRKTDAANGDALPGAVFSITKQNGEYVAEVTTGEGGRASIASVEPGRYVITETKAPAGYTIDGAAKTVEVKSGVPAVVNFTNKPLSGIEILKTDSVSRAPLSGATFTVERDDGEKIGTYKTDSAGKIIVSGMTEGTYIVSETIAPDGYVLDNAPQTVTVKSGKLTAAEFVNKPFSGIEIRKTDAANGDALSGAVFSITKQNGEYVAEVTTGEGGRASVASVEPGWYVITETKAPAGYMIDGAAKTVEVKSGVPTVINFTDKPLSGLKIIKLNSETRQPIEGVEFTVGKMDGERVENEYRSSTFKTDNTGQIFIPQLADGYYIVTETKAADGYILDNAPKTVVVQSGKTTLLEVYNTPVSGLTILKTDEQTRKPLAGVKFEVKKPSGEQIGIFTTDASGRIDITDIAEGKYLVVETQALPGYEQDAAAREVTVTAGKNTTLEVTNTQRAGFRLLKIDSVTKKGIYNVEFMVFDANNKQVGTFITDNNGVIDFGGILTEGRYTVRETRPAPGYYTDDMPRTVEFKSGKVTEVVWENTAQAGQIQILKLSGDDNEVNGLPKGSPLSGAVFEVYAYKSGNLIDRFVSGSDGRAVSKPLPLGRYIVKEVESPAYYKLSSESMDIEVEFATQIIKREFLNYSANTSVTIKKTGNYEAMPGDTIRYDIREMRNDSTVPLTDFFWRDVLPTDAARLDRIVTGTYNQSLKYKVMITTNKGDTRVIADNLSTTQNNVIDCRAAALGLASDEYVTSFTFIFGTVKAGFTVVEKPQINMTVLKNLPGGYEFANKADCGGKHGGEFIVGGSVWVTKIYAPPVKLPRTGY